MHDTAFQIGTLAMNIYADLKEGSILEIGSQSVNGSLRENALSSTKYVGLDIEEGEGVDVVVEPGKPLPFEDASFDFVVASSVFEHDPCFWMTFLEMCRVTKNGGYIYINAPSNGVVHRYPQDNWRFYPDSGRALAQWAVSQGHHASLVESFTADREADIWNDFVAVFRKGKITKALPKVFLHEHITSFNVVTWKSKEVANRRDEPQDMALLREANDRVRTTEDSLAEVTRQRETVAGEAAQLAARLAAAEEQGRQHIAERDLLQQQLVEAAKIRGELTVRESELRQRQEEIEQTRAELTQARQERDDTKAQLTGTERRFELEAILRGQAEAMADQWRTLHERDQAGLADLTTAHDVLSKEHAQLEKERGDLQRVRSDNDRKIDELNKAVRTAQDKCRDHEEKWAAHFGETAALSRMLLDREQQTLREREKVERFRELYYALSGQPRWWSILPRSSQTRREHRRLSRLGLFDAQSYLRKNPDVAASGMDPVHHYLIHGIDEDRQA